MASGLMGLSYSTDDDASDDERDTGKGGLVVYGAHDDDNDSEEEEEERGAKFGQFAKDENVKKTGTSTVHAGRAILNTLSGN